MDNENQNENLQPDGSAGENPVQPIQATPTAPLQAGALPANQMPAPYVAAPAVTAPGVQPIVQQTGSIQPSTMPPANVSSSDVAWQQIVAQQQQQIEALMAQNAGLNGQVVSLIQGGGQLTAGQQPMHQMQPMQAVQPIAQPVMPVHPSQIQQMQQLGAQPNTMGAMNPPSLSDSADYSLESLAEDIGKPNPKPEQSSK